MIQLTDLVPAAEDGWALLFALAEDNDSDWILIGGQLTYLLAVEHEPCSPARPWTWTSWSTSG